MPLNRELAGTIIEAHEVAGKALIALIALHVIGALKHHFVDRDNVLRRMLPFIHPRP